MGQTVLGDFTLIIKTAVKAWSCVLSNNSIQYLQRYKITNVNFSELPQ